jgi:hypothetical protein
MVLHRVKRKRKRENAKKACEHHQNYGRASATRLPRAINQGKGTEKLGGQSNGTVRVKNNVGK